MKLRIPRKHVVEVIHLIHFRSVFPAPHVSMGYSRLGSERESPKRVGFQRRLATGLEEIMLPQRLVMRLSEQPVALRPGEIGYAS